MHQYSNKAALFLILWSVIGVTVTYVYGLLISAIEMLFHVEINRSGVKSEVTLSWFFIGCIIVPLLETLLFQKMPYDAFAGRKWLVVFAALMFGLAHAYSVTYIIVATINGAGLMYAYISWKGRWISKYWMVTFIHALNNIFFFFSGLIFG